MFLDNLSALFNLDQVKQQDWTPAKTWLKRLLVHHANRQKTIFGTSALSRQPDNIIALLRPEDYSQEEGAVFDVRFDKARGLFGEDIAPFRALLNEYGWQVENLGQSQLSDELSETLEAITDGYDTPKKAGQHLGVKPGTIRKRFMTLKRKKFISESKGVYTVDEKVGNANEVSKDVGFSPNVTALPGVIDRYQGVTDPTAKQTAYRNDLRRIWRDKNIEDLQTTVDALEQIGIEDDAIWRDIVDYLGKVGDSGFKKELLNFAAIRLGLIDKNDGDKWWDGLSDNAAHLLAYLRQNGGRASYRDGINGLSYDDAKDAVYHLMAHGFAEDYRYQFEVELSVN
ncbi:hypothetical protein PN36_31410 [Candidatus Thiomargarita nelsonii]|uniref:Uncharacterized protein n=1 Tax=Candidatus Thiomargarita nelsonii TaxID=1003181 RepID=A0A0A6PB76_9GAMM|nr:hypothetical protein PN36_31410 [Candidatus Thiomargarita nelsonii]